MGFKTSAKKKSSDSSAVSGEDFFRQSICPSITNCKNIISVDDINSLLISNKLPSDCKTLFPGEPVRSDWVCPKLICFHLIPFKYGLSFPFPNLVLDFFTVFKLSPAKIMPGLWRLLLSTDVVGNECGVVLGIKEVFSVYDLRILEAGRYGCRVRPGCEHLILGSSEVSDRQWRAKYFFVEKDSLGDLGVALESNWSEAGVNSIELGENPDSTELVNKFLAIPTAKRRFTTGRKDKAVLKRSRSDKKETNTSDMDKGSSRISRGSLRGHIIKNMIKKEKNETSISSESKPSTLSAPKLQPIKKQKIKHEVEDVVILGTKMVDITTSLKTFRTSAAESHFEGQCGPEVINSADLYTMQALHSLAVAQARMDQLESEVINLRGEKIEADTLRLNYQMVLSDKVELEKLVKDQEAIIATLKAENGEQQSVLEKYEEEAKDNAKYFGWVGRLEVLKEYNKEEFKDEVKEFNVQYPEDLTLAHVEAVKDKPDDIVEDATAAVVQTVISSVENVTPGNPEDVITPA